MGAMSVLKVGGPEALPANIATGHNKMAANCFISLHLYFTLLIAHPNALVRGLGTGLPASTASSASRKSNLVGSGRRTLISSTRLAMRPRASSAPPRVRAAADG